MTWRWLNCLGAVSSTRYTLRRNGENIERFGLEFTKYVNSKNYFVAHGIINLQYSFILFLIGDKLTFRRLMYTQIAE